MLESLNSAQKEAAAHIDGPLLILAGAGSGKTKTITTRLAYLIGEVGIDPINTLTLTFTNKAATEMRNRALNLLQNSNYLHTMPLLCTFHKFGLLFLRFYIDKLNRDNNFIIIDNEDKKRLIKNIAKELKIDLQPSFIASEISHYKNALFSPKEAIYKAEMEDYKKVAQIYEAYENNLLENNLVDFDDLIVLTYKILKDNDDLREMISNKYQYIMVDEYQDTNELQFKLLELLASKHQNLCVVGDDDQSIYGWRGANIKNILEFSSHFPSCKIVKLEINYRSTNQILKAANLLIEHNKNRLGKKLISHKGDGEDVKLLHYSDETIEANEIAKKIKELINSGTLPEDIAILYRINALSRSIEEAFNKHKIPYKLVGAIRFYERAEIKDIISYFRIIENPLDDFSLIRIINKPKRGVGESSLNKLKNFAASNNMAIFETIKNLSLLELQKITTKKGAASLKEFVEKIEMLQEEAKKSLYSFIDLFEELIDLKGFYAYSNEGMEKILNIDEFLGYFRDQIKKNPSISLGDFLSEISLQSDQDQLTTSSVNVMSIHASKGLEFEHLFVIGWEEEFFPLLGEGSNLEEERRLAYVAITRAKSNLALSYVDSRFYKGRRKALQKSRFLSEAGLIKGEKIKLNKSSSFKKGDLVKHKIFGIGRVQQVTKSSKDYKLLINFGGTKKEILSSFVEHI